MKATVIGWFGKNNLGDDLLEIIVREVILNSTSTSYLTTLPIDQLYKNKSSEREIADSDVVFIGPGGLINRGVDYIIEPLKKAKKIVLIGISIEDYTGSSDKILQFLAEKAEISLFRDFDSISYFKRFSPTGSVSLISDLFLSANAEAFPENITFNPDKKLISIPRLWDKEMFQNRYARFLKNKINNPSWLLSKTQSDEIIAMCKSSDDICVIDPADRDFFYYLSNTYKNNFIGCASSEDELKRWLVGKNLISARYHGTLIALKNGIYTESYCYQNKLKSLCLTYGLPIYSHNNMKGGISLSKLKDDGLNSILQIKSKLSYL